jgi:flagellar biosynthesis protein
MTRMPIAVALKYDPNVDRAPRVVAKGRGAVADRIQQEARVHSISMIAQPSLAYALSRLKLNEEIPKELYVAVARVLAYIYEQRRSGSGSGL